MGRDARLSPPKPRQPNRFAGLSYVWNKGRHPLLLFPNTFAEGKTRAPAKGRASVVGRQPGETLFLVAASLAHQGRNLHRDGLVNLGVFSIRLGNHHRRAFV